MSEIKIVSKNRKKIAVSVPKKLNIKVNEHARTITNQPINVIYDGNNASSDILDGGVF